METKTSCWIYALPLGENLERAWSIFEMFGRLPGRSIKGIELQFRIES